jgi:RNA polymerase-binding protein DksA
MKAMDRGLAEIYRRHLLNHRWILTREYWKEREASREPDEKETEELRDLLLSLGEIERERLIQIDEALIRIDRGAYGVCAQCGVHIPESRLDAVPWAELCIVCQARREEPPPRRPEPLHGSPQL